MKRLKEFILEKLTGSKIKAKYIPQTKEELIDLIIKELTINGSNCSLNHIDVSLIDDMGYLFRGGDALDYRDGHPVLSKFNGDISQWDVSNVSNMTNMFCKSKFNGDISQWDVSNVSNMTGMFYDSDFNSDISNWDVSNVIDMSSMFFKAKFNGDISNWDVSNVNNMSYMFMDSSFKGDISKWQINPKAKWNMVNMFRNSPLENNPPAWYHK